MGGLAAFLQGMREVGGLRGRGKDPEAVVETSGRGETANGHVKRYSGGGKGSAASRIWQAWRGQGRQGGSVV